MRKSELRRIIREEISRLNESAFASHEEAQYAIEKILKRPIDGLNGFCYIEDDSTSIKHFKKVYRSQSAAKRWLRSEPIQMQLPAGFHSSEGLIRQVYTFGLQFFDFSEIK